MKLIDKIIKQCEKTLELIEINKSKSKEYNSFIDELLSETKKNKDKKQ